MPKTSVASHSLKERWASLLGATLETWAHQLLYVRHVYPRSTFAPTRFLATSATTRTNTSNSGGGGGGIQCKANRHPQVVSYIRDSVKVAVPAIVSGAVNEVSFVITEIDGASGLATADLETYTLTLNNASQEAIDRLDELPPHGVSERADETRRLRNIEYMERAMRDLILRVNSLDTGKGCRPSRRPKENTNYPSTPTDEDENDISFRITLHIPKKNDSCPELNEAFSGGLWLASSTTSALSPASPNSDYLSPLSPEKDSGEEGKNEHQGIDCADEPVKKPPCIIRPLHHASTPFCQIDFARRITVTRPASKHVENREPLPS